MSERNEYGRRPGSKELGTRTRTQYEKPYGKKPYQGNKRSYENGEREYPKPVYGKPYEGDHRKKNAGGPKGDPAKKPYDRRDGDRKPYDRRREDAPKKPYAFVRSGSASLILSMHGTLRPLM